MVEPFPDLPGVAASFVDSDDDAEALLLAIGRAIVGAAAMEKELLLAIACRRAERDGLTPQLVEEMTRLETSPAGRLHEHLRKLDLPDQLDRRIGDAIDRRNRLVHRTMEDPELVSAVTTGDGMDAAVARVNQLALDCGGLAVELHAVMAPRMAAMVGTTPSELATLVRAIDPSSIQDPRDREQLRALQALGDLNLDELGLP